MKLIEILGIASIVFVTVFTLYAAFVKSSIGGQSMRGAIIEAWLNIIVGFGINYWLNILLLPLMIEGAVVTSYAAFWVGCIYTASSIVRQFFLRRLMNWLQQLGIFA